MLSLFYLGNNLNNFRATDYKIGYQNEVNQRVTKQVVQ